MSTALAAMQQPAVRRFLVAAALSSVGETLLITVLFKQAFDLTGHERDIGWLGLAQFLPAVALVLVSGWVADRFDRRVISAVFFVARGLCAGLFLAYTVAAPGGIAWLLVIAVAYGAADAMIAPAYRSMSPLLATPELFPRVVALWTAVFTGSAIVGPVLGGWLYSIDPRWGYAVAGVLQVAAAIPIMLVAFTRQPERVAHRPTLGIALEGLRFVRRTPIVLAAIALDLFAVLFGGAVALIPAVAEKRLGVGDVAYGWLRAAPGVGAAAMALVLAWVPVRRRVGPTLLVVVAIFGAGTIVFGLTRNYAVAFAALVVVSAADMVSMFIRGSLVPLATPEDQLGRVTAVEGVFIGASNELGAFESGMAASALGLPVAIAGGGALTVGIAAVFACAFPTLRRIDTFEEVRAS